MSQKFVSVLKDKLEAKDEVQRSFPVSYDGKSGYIALSQMKVLFVEETGLFSKNYNVIIDVPYTNVDAIATKGDRQLIISEKGSTTHSFTSNEVSPSVIEQYLKELTKA
jgi:hypothetical protein